MIGGVMDAASVNKLRGELKTQKVDDLFLDPQNPRLPEELQGASQDRLVRYLYDTAVLEELARSFVNNGFFEHEPLIVVSSGVPRQYTVLEGNRRLAALMILHRRPEAGDLSFDIEITPEQLESLREIPCFEVQTLEEVYKFLGFRHIGGIKKWSPEAKARYIAREVERFRESDTSRNPFREVAKRVGSNTQGIRNNYMAIAILRHAREEFGLNVNALQNERFGVWQRALNSPEIRDYIGISDALEYDEINTALRTLNLERLKRVITDLTAPEAGKRPLVADSRQLTDYGRILTNKRASEMLLRYKDFEVAKRVIDEIDLPKRIRSIHQQCEIILQDVQRAVGSDDLLAAATDLFGASRAILGAAKQLMTDNE
jgi:hypothetical protein